LVQRILTFLAHFISEKTIKKVLIQRQGALRVLIAKFLKLFKDAVIQSGIGGMVG
jgi:hypothetical protein